MFQNNFWRNNQNNGVFWPIYIMAELSKIWRNHGRITNKSNLGHISDIFRTCIDSGLPEPIFREESGSFAVMLRKFKTPEELETLKLNERQKKALDYVYWKEEITRREYMQITKVSNKTAYLDLKDLIDKGLLVQVGKGRGVKYRRKGND